MLNLYANPYSCDATGFYFTSMDEFEAEYEKHLPVEEYMIEFIDGDDDERRLFDAVKPSGNPAEFFDALDDLDSEARVVAYEYLRGVGCDHDEALRKVDSVCVFYGSEEDYAGECVDEGMYGVVPDALKTHIDYASIANDLRCNGDVVPMDGGWLITNANDV